MIRLRTSRPSGFTLTEFLVVVGILAVLAAVLSAVFISAGEWVRRGRCMNNQRQLAEAILLEASEQGEVLPAAADYRSGFSLNRKVFVCPNAPNAPSGYLVNELMLGKPLKILDHPEKRILTTDAAPGTPLVASLTHAAFRHRGKVIASFLDGHVAVLADFLAQTPIYCYDRLGTTQIMRMYGDGSGKITLANPGVCPSVSANGGVVAFYRFDDVSMTYYVMDAYGRGTRPVVTAATEQIAAADLSPDGRYLYYLGNDAKFHAWGLYRIGVDGRGRRQLKVLPNQTLNSSLAVSPDGTQIVYDGPNWGTTSDLYLVKNDGSPVRQLTHDGMSMYPVFHPNGHEIAYVKITKHSQYTLHLIDTDGHARQRVLAPWYFIGSLSFTPDGRYIVFAGNTTSDARGMALYAVKPDGSDRKVILRGTSVDVPDCGVN